MVDSFDAVVGFVMFMDRVRIKRLLTFSPCMECGASCCQFHYPFALCHLCVMYYDVVSCVVQVSLLLVDRDDREDYDESADRALQTRTFHAHVVLEHEGSWWRIADLE